MIFTHAYQANCVRCPNPLMAQDKNVVYIGLLKITSLCIFVVNKSHRSTEEVFLHFSDSLPPAKSNTVFGKITLMALEKYSLETEEHLVLPLCNEQQQQYPMPESEKV